MSTTFFKRLGSHISRFFSQQQDGNLTSGAGIAAALLIYGAGLAGIPVDPVTAAAIVAGITAVFGAGKKAS